MNGGPSDYRERELKFDVPDDWVLPRTTALVPKQGGIQVELVRLESTYYDTVDRDLLRAGLTLRRRTGDVDTGWQLKVPDGDARIEIRLPLGGRGVPQELRALTRGVGGRAALKPVAVVRTERAAHRLLDRHGVALAELVVDSVEARDSSDPPATRRWREVEVELLQGDDDVLAQAARWLTKRGARPAASASKLARAVGVDTRPVRDVGTLAGLVVGYLDQQYEAIVRGDIDLRRGEDAIHATRVATRRYRSALRGFAGGLDADRASALDTELAWFANALGAVRDRQVLRPHLDDLLAALPAELIVGPVAERIDRTLSAEQAQAEGDLARVMSTRRYVELLRELRAWREQPPITLRGPATAAAARLDAAERAVRKRLRAAPGAADPDVAMHRARKAAKRARYLAELGEPALGKRARKAEKRAARITRRLGDRQDGVLAAEFLLRAAAIAAGAAGEDGLTFGVLHERARRRR